jgi:hypothetical protein
VFGVDADHRRGRVGGDSHYLQIDWLRKMHQVEGAAMLRLRKQPLKNINGNADHGDQVLTIFKLTGYEKCT